MLLHLVSSVLSNYHLFLKFSKLFKHSKILKNSKIFSNSKILENAKKVYDKITKPILKNSKKVYDVTMAELKCNHWRRDSITNITSDVIEFCQLSSHQSSTFFWNFQKFRKIQKLWKNLKSRQIQFSNYQKYFNL